jgi:hypothetical protein
MGTPKEYERVTINPNTAADIMFNWLSATTLYNKASIPTATPTAMMAFMATVNPKFQPDGVLVQQLNHYLLVHLKIFLSF